MRINPHQTTNNPAYGVGQNNRRSSAPGDKTAAQGQTGTDAAVKVDISENALTISRGLQTHDEKSPLKLDEAFFSQETREQRKADFAAALSRSVEIDPLDNEFQIVGVKGVFNEGTLEKFISDGLEGKVKNASLVADELGKMIRGTIHNPDATVEERATVRETALKHAEYLAQNYFDNPDEAKAFLDGINRFAENDVMREKGYIVLDNSDMAPFKSYQSSVKDGGISWNTYAKQHGLSSVKDIFADQKTLSSFYSALQKNNQKWSEDTVKSFDEYEQKVTDIISQIKSSLSEDDVANSLQRLMKAF